MKTINNLLKKLLATALIAVVVLTLSACGGPPQDGKNYWRIDEKDILGPFKDVMPRALYNKDDNFLEKDVENDEAASKLFGLVAKTTDFYTAGRVPYKIVNGERYLEAPDTGAFYFPDAEIFDRLEQGIKPPEIRLWYVYTDNQGIARCRERWIGITQSSFIYSVGPNQTLTIKIASGGPYDSLRDASFILSSSKNPYVYYP